MKSPVAKRHLVAAIAVCITVFAITVQSAFATHYRGGSVKWEKDTTYVSATDNRFNVTFTAGLRWSFPYGGAASRCAIYGITPTSTTGTGACPDIGTLINLGTVTYQLPSNAGIVLRSNVSGPALPSSPAAAVVAFNARVDKFIPAQDLVYVSMTVSVLVPKSTPTVRVGWQNSARLSNILEGNNDTVWQLRTALNHIALRSPEAVMNAVVPVDQGVLNTLTIPTFSEQGSTVSLSIAPIAESLLTRATPSNFSFSSVSPNTINFTPPAAGLYAVQLTATSKDSSGNVLAQAPFEFLLQSTACAVNCKRVVMNAPSNTTVEIGDTLSFAVNASSQNIVPVAPTVTNMQIDSTPLPPGMTVSGTGSLTPGIQRTFTWTPTTADLGSYPVCFQGMTTQVGGPNNVLSKPYCVVFNAIQHNDPPLATCSAPLLNVAAQGATGALASVFATVSDPDLDAMTVSWKVNGNPAGFQAIGGGSGSTQADLSFTFPVGNSVVAASVNDGFTTTTCTTSVSVDKLAQAVVLNAPASVIFGTPSVALTSTAASGNPVALQVLSGPGTLSGSILNIIGVGEIVVQASANGNAIYLAGTATASIIVVDATAPVVTVPGTVTAEAIDASGAPVTFAASALDNVDGAVTAACNIASGAVFAIGTTTVTCTAVDAAANTGSASFSVIVRDTVAPVIGAAAMTTAEATAATGAIVGYVTPSTADAVSGAGTAVCAPAAGSLFALGITTVNCTAYDAASNSATSTFTVTVVDTTAPSIAAAGNVTADATGAAGGVAAYAAPAATDLVDGAVAVSCVPASGSLFAPGATTVTCTASDSRGNAASSSFTVTINDVTPPSIAPHGPETAEAAGASGAIVTFTAPLATDSVDGSVSVSCAPASGSTFAIGTTTVTCTAADAAGNGASSSFGVTVADTIAPVIAAHADITVNATSASGAVVNYIQPATTDAVDGNGTAVCTPAGGAFPIGATLVSCTASDARGNAAASTSFTVTVVNNAPSITPIADITAEATGAAGALVTFASVGSDVEDGALTGACIPASGSTFAIGNTLVTCTVTDVTTAAASDSFIVTVRDTTAPAVTVASVTVPAVSASGAMVSFAASALDVVSGAVAVSCAPASGSTFALGTTAVTCTATDARGNTGTGHGSVTVTDGIAPVVTYTGNAGTYNVAQTVNIACAASDIGTGVASTTCANISGPAYTFALGVNNFSATATDHAGNVGSGGTSFTVVVTNQSLRQLVLAWVSNSGIANALVNKLDQADRAPNANARRGMVGAFENQLSGQIGKTITAAHAATILQLLHALYP
jgi:hypothetical protein